MLSEVGRQTTVAGGQGAARKQSVTPPQSSARPDELSAALAACRAAFFGIGLFSGVINVLMLTGSFYMLEVYDRVLPSRSLPTLAGLTIVAGGLFAFLGLLDLIRGRVLARIAASIDHDLTGRVYDSFIRLPLKLGNRDDGIQPLRDLDRVREFLSGLGPVALFDLPWIPIYLLVCFAFHVWIGIAALAGAIVLIGFDARHRATHPQTKPGGKPTGGGAQRLCRDQPAQRRGDRRYGHGGAAAQAVERSEC
jgi:ABC-type protease/lipase transport system fused ATPase/permease subunit